jgi:propanol-preferring alcohol dehydrogenase
MKATGLVCPGSIPPAAIADIAMPGGKRSCKQQQNTGYSANGSFAEYALADPDYVGHLPDSVSFIEIAPILCAGVTVYKV